MAGILEKDLVNEEDELQLMVDPSSISRNKIHIFPIFLEFAEQPKN